MALPSPGGNQVAVRYLGLVPTIKGFERNLGRELASSSIQNQASGAGRSIGSRLGSTITSSVKNTLKVGGIITAAVAGLTLKGGINRALGIEDAQAKMAGLGHDTETVDKIMGNALSSVEGTAFGLDAAATTAAGAVAAGIKPGQELEGVLSTVANTAAATGGTMEEVGGIFNSVAAVGTAYTGDINMIAQRGVPIWQTLGDQLGVTQDEVKKMARNGEIDFATFSAAAEAASGDVATAMGDTTRGSVANMLTAFSKLGADLVQRFLPMVKTGAQGIQAVVQALTAKLGPILDKLFDSFTPNATAGIEGFFDGLVAKIDAFDPQVILNFFDSVGGYISGLDFSSFGGFIDSLSGIDLSGLFPSGGAGGDALGSVGQSLAQIALASPSLIAAGLEVLGDAMAFLAEHSDTIVKLLPAIVAGFAAYKVATTGAAYATQALATADLISLPLQIQRNLTSQQAAYWRYQAAMATRGEVAADAAKSTSTIRATVAERARTIATKASTIASKTAAIATRALGAAIRFMTGPIGLIITAVAALVAGLIWFFTQTETGQKIWEKVWGAIKAAALSVADWFMNTVWPMMQTAWDGIAAGATWLYESAILPAWSGIQTAVQVVGDWITQTLWPAIQTAWDAIGTAALWLYQNVIQPVWTGIKTAIAIAVTAVLLYIDMLKFYWENVIAPVAMWLWQSVIQPVWNGIKTAIGAVIDWFQNTAWPALKLAWDALAAAATWLWQNVMVPVWNGIKAAIDAVVGWFQNTAWPLISMVIDWLKMSFEGWKIIASAVWGIIRAAIDAVVQWFQNTVWPIINTVIGWLKMSFEGWKIIASAVWSAVKTAIDTVARWFQNTAWPLISGVIENIKTGFNVMRDGLKAAWDFIKNNIISPVATWFRDTVGPMFDTVTDGIKSAFDKMKDAIEKAWNGIRDTAKAPVKFLVETIIRDGIISKYNDVVSIFGLDKVDTSKFSVGWSSGGYTGPGHKYTPAGVVHADEYVIRKESQRSLARRAPGFLDALNAHGANALSAMGYAGGGKVKSVKELLEEAQALAGTFGLTKTSGYRPGAKTAGSGSVSLHALGKAIDVSGSAGAMMSFFNAADAKFGNLITELLYSPAGARNIHRGGKRYANTGATKRNHYNHVHIGFMNGGVPGEGGGWGWNPFEGLWDSLKEKAREGLGDSPFGDVLFEAPQKIISGAIDWAKEKLTEIGSFVSDGVQGAASRARWAPVMTRALSMKGEMGAMRLKWGLDRLMQESGGDPRAINNWDSNAKRGTPSKGLMQVIGPTFQRYAEPGYSSDIYDPLSNILASINYTLATYGSLKKGWTRKGGYADGGLVQPTLYDSGGRLQPGVQVIANKTNRPETILPPEESAALTRIARNGGAVENHYHYSPTQTDLDSEIGNRTRREFETMVRAAEEAMFS